MWEARGQLLHAFDAIHSREIDIHQGHIRLVPWDAADGILAIGVAADAGDAWRVAHQCGEVFPRALVVFDDGNFDDHSVVEKVRCTDAKDPTAAPAQSPCLFLEYSSR